MVIYFQLHEQLAHMTVLRRKGLLVACKIYKLKNAELGKVAAFSSFAAGNEALKTVTQASFHSP